MKTLPTYFHSARFTCKTLVRAAALVAVCVTVAQSRAAVDAFIKFTSVSPVLAIPGDSADSVFQGSDGWFEIKDFSFGVENPTTIGSATGGAGAGKIKFNEFTIKKTTDQASPAFFKNCATGSHYKNVTLAMRKAGGDPTKGGGAYLVYQFNVVFTTKIDWSGPGDEGPEESITFVYGSFLINYRKQNPDGTLAHPGTTTFWDVITNTSVFDSPTVVP